MSYFLQQDEEQQGLNNPTAPLPMAGTGQGATPTPTHSGAFQDIRKYLSANQDQAQGMGEKVGQNIQDQLTSQENTANQANQDFTTQINQNKPILTMDQIHQAALNPAGFASNDQNLNNFLQTYHQQYTGPSAPADTSAQANKVKELSDLTKSSGGREQLVKGIYQQPERATRGQLSLDNALIQETPNAINAITGKQTEAQRISDEIASQNKAQQDAIGGVKKDITDRQDQINKEFWQNPDSAYNKISKGNAYSKNEINSKKAELKALKSLIGWDNPQLDYNYYASEPLKVGPKVFPYTKNNPYQIPQKIKKIDRRIV